MLIHQGAEQFKLFTGKNPPISVMKQAILEVI
jgi:shikimate 5-dehydrogenase